MTFYFFLPKPKYWSSSENGLLWSSWKPVGGFGLNWVLQDLQKVCQWTWSKKLSEPIFHLIQKVLPSHHDKEAALPELEHASVTGSSSLVSPRQLDWEPIVTSIHWSCFYPLVHMSLRSLILSLSLSVLFSFYFVLIFNHDISGTVWHPVYILPFEFLW